LQINQPPLAGEGGMMMERNNRKSNIRYFILERDRLSDYGNAIGSDKAEAERLLAESGESIGELVVIRGELVEPTFKL
jgi:hypothetical protein